MVVLLYCCWHSSVAAGSESVWQRGQIRYTREQNISNLGYISVEQYGFLARERIKQNKNNAKRNDAASEKVLSIKSGAKVRNLGAVEFISMSVK